MEGSSLNSGCVTRVLGLVIAQWLLATTPVLAQTQEQTPELPARPLPAHSRFGLMFPMGSGLLEESPADDALRSEALSAMERTLRALEYRVMTPNEVLVGLNDSEDAHCERGIYRCPPEVVLRSLELDAVVMLALWTEGDGPPNVNVEVTLADRVGQARGTIDGEARQQIPNLLMRALADTEQGRAVRFQIDTVPTGAEISVDGHIVGISPLTTTDRYAPGQHQVTLAKPGYVTTTTHFELPRGAADPFVQAAKMDPKGAPAPASATAPTEPTAKWDYALGATLAVVGVALVISPLATLAESGECHDEVAPSGRCDSVKFGSRSGVQLGAAALALGLATYTLLATPVRASLSTSGDELHVGMATTF